MTQAGDYGRDQPASLRRKMTPEQIRRYLEIRRERIRVPDETPLAGQTPPDLPVKARK